MSLRKYVREILEEKFTAPKFITVYHGTMLNKVDSIKAKGLQANPNLGYNSAGWYMVSTDIASALFHANTEEGQDAPVVEFKVPCTNKHWEGYPYFWPPADMSSGSKWFALKQVLPAKFIKKVHYFSYEKFLQQKDDKF